MVFLLSPYVRGLTAASKCFIDISRAQPTFPVQMTVIQLCGSSNYSFSVGSSLHTCKTSVLEGTKEISKIKGYKQWMTQ